ncbi:MAG: NAD kinase [Pirellulaceae bacterium]|nr:MAG: NAD kinase [Pirellulaceae bacterium]
MADYIERHRLYQGAPAAGQCAYRLRACRLELFYDEHNRQAAEMAGALARYHGPDPELLVVLGGDGTMLRAVRQCWRRRIPFYGVNIGHLGFLLNEQLPDRVANQDLVLWELPLLYVELEYQDGSHQHAWAFNDTWVERATGQTAWLEVRVDGQVRVPHLVADGALVATAAGSTAYARAMGAVPLPLGTPALLLVGSNVLRPVSWRPVVLPVTSEVTLTTLDPVKRPLQAYVDGVALGNVCRLRVRVSRVASVEMVFTPPHDPAAKLAAIQFPLHE